MDLLSLVVHEGTEVTGTGMVTIDGSGAIYLVPNTPALDPVRQAGRTIPLQYNNIDRALDGEWVSLVGQRTGTGVHVSSVDRIDRPAYPREPTVRVTNPSNTGWTRDQILGTVEDTDLLGTDLIIGTGVRHEQDGTSTLSLDCLYIDELIAAWLGRSQPGDVEVLTTLVPR